MNIYQKNGLKEVINASGRMSKLGVSVVDFEVGSAMLEAAQHYVLIDELMEWSGKRIGSLIGCEDACVCASASSGIALSIASLICGNNLQKVQHFSDTLQTNERREVILLKGHNVDFGAPISTIIESGGGIVKEVGYANASCLGDVIHAINEKTLAIMFVKSHHCVQKHMVGIKEVIELANSRGIPCIIDAAAEEDLSCYSKLGADFVCYSGAKAISGPTSGFVACRKSEDAKAMRLQYRGIGRIMKIGKENCMGLLKAIELYQTNHGYLANVCLEDLKIFQDECNKIEGITAKIIQDEAGRNIWRCQCMIDETLYGKNAIELVKDLENYQPAIYTRDYNANQNWIAIDPRPLKSKDDLITIIAAFRELKG